MQQVFKHSVGFVALALKQGFKKDLQYSLSFYNVLGSFMVTLYNYYVNPFHLNALGGARVIVVSCFRGGEGWRGWC